MKPRDVRSYLFDVAKACNLLKSFLAGKSLTDYSADPLLRSGVERQFEILGEALNQAVRVDPDIKNLISDTEKIIGFRNRLIHAYFALADETVWGIIETRLPALCREVKVLLDGDA